MNKSISKVRSTTADTQRLEQASDWLIRLQEDGLPDEEIARWIDWCEEHEDNRKAFQSLLPLWQAFDDRKEQTHPLKGKDVLPFSSTEGKDFSGKGRARVSWALAASLLLALAATLFVFKTGKRDTLPMLNSVATFASKPAQLRPATLPDGSKLDLGARSAIAIDFTGPQRQIEMQDGEAFFTVKHDKTRPFIVRAGGVRITAVGTAFNVQKTDARIVVTVTEGAVQVSSSFPRGRRSSETNIAGTIPSATLLAPAGYQVIYDAALSPEAAMRAVNPTAATAWRNGHLEYLSEPLSSVIATLNRYSEHPIALQDPTLAHLNYTGTIEVKSLEEWLHALPRIFPVEIQQGSENQLQITRRP